MLVIIDVGIGNILSVQNMLRFLGKEVNVSNKVDDILSAEKLILPGVGAFDAAMENINKLGLADVIKHKVFEKKTPILGICLGMHLLTKKSFEGTLEGLSLVDAEVKKFPHDLTLKVPHMGWKNIDIKRSSPLSKNLNEDTKFYFAHSYYVKLENSEEEVFSCNYILKFTCCFQRDNICGAQFHPEKSHKHGMQFLTNFVEI